MSVTITPKQVRSYLANISVNRISDDAIAIQIGIAKTVVNNYASIEDPEDYKSALITTSGFLAYQAYLTEYERSAGNVPPAERNHLEDLRASMNLVLGASKKGNPEYKVPIAFNTSLAPTTLG